MWAEVDDSRPMPRGGGMHDCDRQLSATMATVREHYDEVLSQHYSRMFGDFEAKVAEQQALLERLGTRARQGGSVAVDLGLRLRVPVNRAGTPGLPCAGHRLQPSAPR